MKKTSDTLSSPLMRTSLGRSLAVFMLVIALTVAGINAWSLWHDWQLKLAQRENEARNLSVSLARQAEDAFLQVDITLADAVRQLMQHGPEYAATSAFKTQIRAQQGKLPQLHGLFIYDSRGNWVATSGSYVPAKASNADRDYFIWHRTHDDSGILISRVIRSRSTGDLVIPVSVRLNDATGNFAGVALATVKVDYFRQFYSYYSLGEKDVLALILADTSVLYIRPLPESFINRSLSASPLFKTALKASDSGSATWRSALDGVERVFGYARLERYPLIVTAGYDRDAARAEWISENLVDLALNIALLFIITGMGFFMLRQVRVNVKNQLELTLVRDELTSINHTLQSLALVDGLTGLANRRQFDALLEKNLERSAKTGEPLSLIMVDIDYFKRYNDTYGHVTGDQCLRNVGIALKSNIHRSDDIVARYGGEEFAIILPNTGPTDALKVAQRAVQTVSDAGLAHKATSVPGGAVTISAGCGTITARGDAGEAAGLKELADNALYRAKRNGRNRAVTGSSQPEQHRI
ncbi:sensor domain-containing diguanylate cyclase [Pantoea sp. LMR881]|uniref:sensor domain-containing diguanylate cyclase n=1 Tax=Pantoea sp. LMR881 TaxID=3014336 RepID=UPI002F35965E